MGKKAESLTTKRKIDAKERGEMAGGEKLRLCVRKQAGRNILPRSAVGKLGDRILRRLPWMGEHFLHKGEKPEPGRGQRTIRLSGIEETISTSKKDSRTHRGKRNSCPLQRRVARRQRKEDPGRRSKACVLQPLRRGGAKKI